MPPQSFDLKQSRHVGVKEAVFPFARFGDKVDTVLGPEMKSTGEVMGLDRDYSVAFAKSQLGGGARLPKEGTVFVSVRDGDKPRILEPLQDAAEARLQGDRHLGNPALPRRERGRGGQDQQGGRRPAAHRRRHQKRPGSAGFQHHRGGHGPGRQPSLRRAALLHKVPYYTTLSGAVAAAQGIKAYLGGDLEVRALQSYFGGRA